MDYKLKNEVRAFRLTQFRNIGYGKDSEEHSTLILNYSLNPDYMGDLVILIGPNNSGKSNVLKALCTFNDLDINQDDFSDTRTENNEQNPSLNLFASPKKDQYIYQYIVDKNNNLQFIDENKKVFKQSNFNIDSYVQLMVILKNDTFWNSLITIANTVYKYHFNNDKIIFKNNYQIINPQTGLLNPEYVKANLSILQNCIKKLFENRQKYDKYDQLIQEIENLNSQLFTFIHNYQQYLIESENLKWLPKKPPKIIRYVENKITDNDLKFKINELDESSFFNSLMHILKIDKSFILNIYTKYKQNNNDSILSQNAKKFNKEFNSDVEKLFNELYCINEDKYRFEFNFHPEYIAFNIFKHDHKNNDDIALTLNHQSTGFRWFFNFFFNVYAMKSFAPGDIIIMDEPATNLHVKGQEELRDFLKKFSINSGITFAIATHTPFFVDLDYLDEIRLLIPQSDNTTWINNSFTTVNPDDVDSLMPICESLTVRNSILLDPNQIVIFVEGITDYNYFVAMKKLIGCFNNLTFLPINGLGKTKQNKEKLDQLRKIKSWNSLILTDGDWQGDKFYKLNENDSNPLAIIKLTDVDPNFKEIENLFDEKDIEKFNLKNLEPKDDIHKWNKNISMSVTFKKLIQKEIWDKQQNPSELTGIVETIQLKISKRYLSIWENS